MRVLGAEPLDGVFGGKDNPTVGCILDACGFVHLVAERRDFQPATRRDLADHERGTPMHADLDAHAVPQCRCPVTNFARRLNRAARRGAVTAGILSKKQRRRAVPGVLAENPRMCADHRIDQVGQRADELKVGA